MSWWSLAVAGAALGTAADGLLVEPNRLEISHRCVRVSGLPPELDGWTVAQVSDLHIGRVRGSHRKVLDALERLEPDLVACTGDLVERPEDLDAFESYARDLVAVSNEIVAVPGNWERKRFRGEFGRLFETFDEIGLPFLSNAWRTFEKGIAIAGGDDPVSDHFDSDTLFDSSPDAPVRIFLVHAPSVLDDAPANAPNFDLALCGHTHGGQVRLGPFAPITPPGSGRFTCGFYETDYGRAYVSRGVGMTRIRFRFMCLPELPIFELRRADGRST